MARQLPPDLLVLAERQCGVVTKRQAAAAGLSRDAVACHVRYGRWQRLHPGVFATFSGGPGRLAVLWAAVLCAGPGAVLSYETAAELAGLLTRPANLVHVTIPTNRRVGARPGLVIHMSARALAALHPARLPSQTRVEETILDLAGAARTIDDACAWPGEQTDHARQAAPHPRASTRLDPPRITRSWTGPDRASSRRRLVPPR
ncbi:MAG TPA: type IV toxin-antitoxin system AbiEi family antitoxin domain-containing protein, partial [Streptosporangiaceae bacterium]|nr:type IV toxin-antitoxin system AbiEi family antitoxin domain-containing protein [Streptosporangiaceae bacterium]